MTILAENKVLFAGNNGIYYYDDEIISFSRLNYDFSEPLEHIKRFNDELELNDVSFITFGDHNITVWNLNTKTLDLQISTSKYVENKILFGMIITFHIYS